MRRRHFLTALSGLSTISLSQTFGGPPPLCAADDIMKPSKRLEPSVARLGINLAGTADWNTELPFADVFRESREWISQRNGESWGKGPTLALDARGWIRRLELDCFAETPLCTIEEGHYPSGVYTVRYDGTGEIGFSKGRIVARQPGEIQVEIDSRDGGFFLRLLKTDPDDYVRNIRVFLPDCADISEKTGAWNPAFLTRWRGMRAIRFMDWMHTNGSQVARWSERPQMSDATWTVRGVPLEMMCELANRLEADPWFCIPHLADDDYVRNFAQQVKKRLLPRRKVYIEYSNEVWNGQFEQNRYAAEMGQKLRFAEKPWEAAWCYTAVRSVEIFAIFEDVFGGTQRLVRVLPSQAANPYVSEQILKFRDAYRHADTLAIAPYMGVSIPKEDTEKYIALELDGVLREMEERVLPECVEWMRGQKKIADQYGLTLTAYEAGQHLVGLWGANDNEKLNEILYAANRSEKMGELYEKYYAAWQEIGGDLLCVFSSTGRWSKWGSWGLVQYADEDGNDYPKYAATMRTMQKWNAAIEGGAK